MENIENSDSLHTLIIIFRAEKVEKAMNIISITFFIMNLYRQTPFGSEFSLPLFFRQLTRALFLPFLSSLSR